jgi:hypothetical protein
MGKYGLSDGLVRDWEKQVFMKTWSCGQKARVDMGSKWVEFRCKKRVKTKENGCFSSLISSKPEVFGRNTIFLC